MRRYDLNPKTKDLEYHSGEYYSTIRYPKIAKHETDIYIITVQGDRLDTIAHKYYNDTTLWWIIATANSIGKGSLSISAGKQIRVPKRLQDILADFEEIKTERS